VHRHSQVKLGSEILPQIIFLLKQDGQNWQANFIKEIKADGIERVFL